jgi:threonine/homoserine/homoserine lactone efflux protein
MTIISEISMWSLFFSAFVIGLALCAPIGPVFAATIRYGLANGYQAALSVQLGSLLGDIFWALIGLFGIGLLAQIEELRVGLGLVGVTCLIWLGINALRKAWRSHPQESRSSGLPSGYVMGAALSLSNVNALMNWAAMGGIVVTLGTEEWAVFNYVLFLIGYMSASALWCFVSAGLVAGGRRFLNQSGFRVLYLFCGVILISMAIVILRKLFA